MGDGEWVIEFQLSVVNTKVISYQLIISVNQRERNCSRRYSQKKPSQIFAEKNLADSRRKYQRKSAFLNLRKSARKNNSRRYSQKIPSQIVAEDGGWGVKSLKVRKVHKVHKVQFSTFYFLLSTFHFPVFSLQSRFFNQSSLLSLTFLTMSAFTFSHSIFSIILGIACSSASSK